MTKMAILVYRESNWEKIYIKQSEGVFLKMMGIVEELESSILSSSLALIEIGVNVCKKVVKIQTELLPLVEEANNLELIVHPNI